MHLSFLFCSSSGVAAATQDMGEAGLGESPVSSGKTTPSCPMGHLHCCCQARAFAFTQLSALNINKQRGLTFPSTSTSAAAASGKPTNARVPAGTSPCSTSAPRVAVQWLVPFLLFSIPVVPMPSLVDPAPQHRRPCPAEQAQGLGGGGCICLPGLPWGTSWHPASVSQSAKSWTTL